MGSKDNLSEIVRTAAAYELFLRLTAEHTSLIEAVFKKEVQHFLECSFKGRGGRRRHEGEQDSPGKA